MCSTDIFLGVLAILFPPLPVWVKRGICSADSLINILLCTLGFVPGLLHAWYIIAKFPDSDYERLPQGSSSYRAEEGRVTYVIVQQPGGHSQPQRQGVKSGGGYGATSTAPRTAAPVAQGVDGTWGVNGGQQSGVVSNSSHAAGSGSGNGEGSSDGAVPPTYAEAVKGDHKVQTRD